MSVRERIVGTLVAAHDSNVTIDAIGAAIGDASVSQADIEAILEALEAAGLRVVSGNEGREGTGVAQLRLVVPAARRLRTTQGRPATVAEIAVETGLEPGVVRAALLLAKVMSRGP